ncbi:hypothetical protein HMPREF9442_02326 [Paraprevotella xylaniphila YIT 11841]|uniref:Uncharacterized protein n=1 Tax=Paraprevotella xylaniphila YIT 11841 TaxID=762982 RepID=F3QW04_9BACT|nr:hypothetical protein HMPREF9442_02326 [Paraprevotella xylaniphila YIT 11841]
MHPKRLSNADGAHTVWAKVWQHHPKRKDNVIKDFKLSHFLISPIIKKPHKNYTYLFHYKGG